MDKPDNRTHGQKRIAERREAMREYLVARGYVEAIDQDLNREISPEELPVVKFKTETRLKLLQKVLPDITESKQDLTVRRVESLQEEQARMVAESFIESQRRLAAVQAKPDPVRSGVQAGLPTSGPSLPDR